MFSVLHSLQSNYVSPKKQKKMNKAELVDAIAAETKLTKADAGSNLLILLL